MRQRVIALLALSALVSLSVPMGAAQAATTYEVKVGAGAGKAFSFRMYPSALKVHQGDTIHFSGLVDVLPAGESAEEWREENQSQPEDPFTVWLPDPDDNSEKFNADLLGDLNCGGEEAPCSYDGTFLHGGLAIAEDPGLYINVDVPPGTVFYTILPIGLNSSIRIEVVNEDAAASDPAAIATQVAEQRDRDKSLATALYNSLSKPTKHKEGKKTVWDAYAGFDTRYLAFFDFFPAKIPAKKGDVVRWHMEFESEAHSATYGRDFGLEVFNESFAFMCDPDGDDGMGPDAPALEEPPFCADPSQFEVDFPPGFFNVVGNGKLNDTDDVESSGVRTPADLQGGGFGEELYWDVELGAKSDAKGFQFFCLFHGFGMSNKIVVK